MAGKIIQIAINPEGVDSVFAIFALCDDGTIWEHCRGKWEKMPTLPINPEGDWNAGVEAALRVIFAEPLDSIPLFAQHQVSARDMKIAAEIRKLKR